MTPEDEKQLENIRAYAKDGWRPLLTDTLWLLAKLDESERARKEAEEQARGGHSIEAYQAYRADVARERERADRAEAALAEERRRHAVEDITVEELNRVAGRRIEELKAQLAEERAKREALGETAIAVQGRWREARERAETAEARVAELEARLK